MISRKTAALTTAVACLGGVGIGATSMTAAHAGSPNITTATYHARNSTVKSVQQDLIKLGYLAPGLNTGYYGDLTNAAVHKYEAAHHEKATNFVYNYDYVRMAKEAAAKKAPVAKKTTVAKKTAASTSFPRLDSRCYTGARVACIDKNHHRLYYVENGHVKDSFSVRTGRPGMRTRNGVWSIYYKNATQRSSIYNNVPMPWSMFFSGGEAIHYSSDFAQNGYGVGSHGCANLRDWSGAKMLYNKMKVGDKVVVYGNN